MSETIRQTADIEEQQQQGVMNPESIRSSDQPVDQSLREAAVLFKSMGLEEEAEAPPGPKRYAVFIAHGMGQQVPFETIDVAVRGLQRVADKVPGVASVDRNVRTRTVRIGTQTQERAEFDLMVKPDGNSDPEKVEVHVYEAYWAPFTEGEVKLKDVMSFLWQGFMGGIRNSFKPLKRWMFEQEAPMKKNKLTSVYFFLTGLILLSLILLNALTGVIVAARILGDKPDAWPGDDLLTVLTFIAALLSGVLLLYGLLLVLVRKFSDSPRKDGPGGLRKTFSALLWIGFWVCCTVVIVSSFAFVYFTVHGYVGTDYIARVMGSPPFTWWPFLGSKVTWIIVWGFLYLVTYLVRNLLVQYPGDVAAYVSSYKLDRFSEIRKKIKGAAFDVLDTVYTATDGTTPYYDRVGLMGHSLGSVVVYDALNAVINKDRLNDNRDRVMERTKVLVTFGSPLDKTAYIFSVFATGTTSIREKLATTKQPLIQDYGYRDFRWVNIYSKRDIVAGSLDYYDCETAKGYSDRRKVQNMEDPNAITPLVAHVEYWENEMVFEEFLKGLV